MTDPYAEAREKVAEALETHANERGWVVLDDDPESLHVAAQALLTAIHFPAYLALAEAAERIMLEREGRTDHATLALASALARIKEGT